MRRGDFPVWKRLCRLSIILLISASGACTQNVPPDKPSLPTFESVAIVSMGPSEELKARFGAVPGNSDSDAGVGIGAGAGALTGAGLSLGCGPFYVMFCAPILSITGALVGAVGGGLADMGVDKLREPSPEQIRALDELFGEIAEQRALDAEIRDALVRQIPPHRLADASLAEALLQISLFDVLFTQTSSGKFTLTLKSLVIAQWNHETRHLNHGRRLYRYTTPELSLKEWLENDGRILNQAFDDCVNGLAEQMAEDIHFDRSTG